jgi:hypothetical protein
VTRQRLFSILWTIEFIAGLLPAVVLIIVGFIPYLVATLAILSALEKADAAVLRTAIVLNGTMIGGILGIVAILMAYRPEKLRENPKLKRRAMIFSCAGLGAASLYVMSEGLSNVTSNGFQSWIIAGPVLLGAHCAYRVFMRHHNDVSSPAAVKLL